MTQRSDTPAAGSPGAGTMEAGRPGGPKAAEGVGGAASALEEAPLSAHLLRDIFKQEVLNHGPPLYVADSQGKLTWSNAAFRRLLAAAGGKLLPFDRIAADIANLGSMAFREDRLQIGDRYHKVRSRHVALRDADGKFAAIAGILQPLGDDAADPDRDGDLQERLDDVLRLVPEWLWESDAQLVLTHSSSRVTELLGYLPYEVVGSGLLSLARDDAHRGELQRRFRRRSPFRNQAVDLIGKTGEARTVLISALPVFDHGSGALTGFRGAATDVTDLRQRELGLKTAMDSARLASKAKTDFLANISHELRTPLNAIIGFAEVMQLQLLGPMGNDKYHGYVGDIHDSARHLLSLINDILDVAKIEAGHVELNETTVEVRALFDAVMRLVRERAVRSRIRLETRIAPGLPAIRADERKLKQIFINLLSNAVGFTPAGGVARLTARLDGDGAMIFTVEDSGIGIAAVDIARVMEPYGQVESAQRQDRPGTGLGLPLTRALVDLHGGSFDLRSNPGAGTTATIRFPASRVQRARTA